MRRSVSSRNFLIGAVAASLKGIGGTPSLARKSGLIQRITLLLGAGTLVAGLFLIISPLSHAQGYTEPGDTTEPLVTVTGGQVQGRHLPAPGGAVFRGIPYAAPPIGDLRWREAQPVKPWAGVLQANQYGPPCPQLPRFGNIQLALKSNENCLFLNVWAPEWPPGAKRPVMLWIHGNDLYGDSAQGGLAEGRVGIRPPFDGTSLARHGVVVVTIDYRTGLMGMIGHPELTAESTHHSSGNYGMLDQIAALKWIHDNIVRFGGDPGNVTVFGQSGGARFTAMLLASPLTKGLIHRAIVESGSVVEQRPYLTPDQLERLGVVLATVLKAPPTDAVKYLRSLPASEIAAAMPDVSNRLKQMNNLAFDEGVDGYVIPQNPPEVYRSHEEAPVPVIIGSNSLDTAVASPLGPEASQEEVLAWMKGVLETFYHKYPDLLERALKIYGVSGGLNKVSTYPPYGTIDDQLGVDLNHRCGSVTMASWHSDLAPTWQYEFTRTTPGHPPLHGAELRYVWGYLGNEEADESARKVSDMMEQYWTNFAKTGDPNGPGLPEWPKYNATKRPYMDFGNEGPIQKTGLRAEACSVYAEKFTRDPKPLFGSENNRLGGGVPRVVP